MAIDPKKIEEWKLHHAGVGGGPPWNARAEGGHWTIDGLPRLDGPSARFIAAARAAVPALLAEVDRLRRLMPEVYNDAYQTALDGEDAELTYYEDGVDEYLAALEARIRGK